MLKMTDKRVGKKVKRDYLIPSQAYSDEYGNIVLRIDDNQVLLLSHCVLWDIKDQYAEHCDFTEVDMEVIIS